MADTGCTHAGEEESYRGHQSDQCRRTMFGLKAGANPQAKASNTYDHHQECDEDAYDEELGPHARFWRILLDEAHVYDLEKIDEWRDSLDVLLVFAGLYSAVVTTLVVQSSQALQPNYGQISVSLLTELIAIQRALANGSPVNDTSLSRGTLASVAASTPDRWCNGFWFISLALSLSAALMAVLVKQWLQAYNTSISGTPKHQALVRQFRLIGIQRWKVGLIVGLLPMLLHASLLLFFIGLSLFVFAFDSAIAWVIISLTILVYALYFAASIAPMLDPQCPFKTPLTHYGLIGRHAFSQIIGWVVRSLDTSDGLDGPSQDSSSNRNIWTPSRAHGVGTLRSWILTTLRPLSCTCSSPSAWMPRSREAAEVTRDETSLIIQCLFWVFATSANPSAISATVQAVSGLPADVASSRPLLHDAMLEATLSRLEALAPSNLGNRHSHAIRERLARSLLFFSLPHTGDWRDRIGNAVDFLDAALASHGVSPHTVELQGAVVALATVGRARVSRLHLFDHTETDKLPFVCVTDPESLRLNSAVWCRVLSFFAEYPSTRNTTAGLHLAVFLWRHAGPDYMKEMAMPTTLPHIIQRALESMEVTALAVKAHEPGARDEREYDTCLKSAEVQFLARVCKHNLSESEAHVLFPQIARLATHTDLWSVDACAELLDAFCGFRKIPPSAVRPLLQSLVHVLSVASVEGSATVGAHSILRNISFVFKFHPVEALHATCADNLLAAIWSHVEAVIDASQSEPQTYAAQLVVEILVSYRGARVLVA